MSWNRSSRPVPSHWPAASSLASPPGHAPLFAATSSCSPTMLGRTDAEAGLKNTAPADSPNGIA
jgi:hypothetical protein